MKKLFLLVVVFTSVQLFAQTNTEKEVLSVSKQIFRLEVENKIDSLENLMHEKLTVVNSKGETLNKQQYIATFRSGSFVHNSIDIEENTVSLIDNIATVAGKGNFNITAAGNNLIRHLSYIEVFIKTKTGWKLFALKASVLPN